MKDEIIEEDNDKYRRKCISMLMYFEEFVDGHYHLDGLEKAREKYRFQEVLNRINQTPDGKKIIFRG